MYSFEILYLDCGEKDLIFGYSWRDACRRANIDPTDRNISVLHQDYED